MTQYNDERTVMNPNLQNQQPNPQLPAAPVDDRLSQYIMPTKNGPSIISYYCGVFGLLPFIGIPFAVIAIIYGHKALKIYKKQPSPGAKAHALTGLIFGYIATVCFLLFFMLIALGVFTG